MQTSDKINPLRMKENQIEAKSIGYFENVTADANSTHSSHIQVVAGCGGLERYR